MFEWYWLGLFFALLHMWTVPLFCIYIHRAHGHGHAHITPAFDQLSRLGLWLTGVSGPCDAASYLRYWVAKHRKHHAYSDTVLDPHSPHFHPRHAVVFFSKTLIPGRAYYLDEHEIDALAPDIIVERNDVVGRLIQRWPYLRWLVLPGICTLLFGWAGTIGAVSMMMIWSIWPMVFNLVSHSWGYRTRTSVNLYDRSRNIVPIGVFFGGDDLAANHHDYPYLANLAIKWYEFDIGYQWMRIYQWLGLLTIIEPDQNV